jgi:hypothetical protein
MARPCMPMWKRPDWAQQHRLALAFLAALGLHLLILGLIKLPVAQIAPPVPSRVLQWVDLPIVKPQPEPVDQMNKPARPETRRGKDAHINRENEVASDMAVGEPGATTISPQPKTEFTAPTRLNPLGLSATARSLAWEMAREEGPVAPAQPDNPTDRPILPLLDQALRKQRPGVQRFEGGLIQIISASGRVYCVQEQPNFARGGPVDPLSVPTNCP